MDHLDAPDPGTGDFPDRISRAALAVRIAAGVVGCVALAGLAFAIDHANRPDGRPFELTGQVATGPTTAADDTVDGDCSGGVAPGAEVVVRDGAGTQLATGRVDTDTPVDGGHAYGFSVAGVPRGHDSYRVTVGDLGAVVVSAPQAEAGLLFLVAT
ncbi:hypothetical protein ACFWPA_13965 [Rhodococcus sp. NPDC058505]|uniref:hypothetical protein n=1 Tax=unclassified Rhodococcus (in: high G+C Gram-positive bacteria) TaxID=192944 RepID=UPI003645FE10